MQEPPFRQCWRSETVGTVTAMGGGDFPWAGGRLSVETQNPELLAVLEWISQQVNSEADLEDPPFREEFDDHWSLISPEGRLDVVGFPCVDLSDGSIEFIATAVSPPGDDQGIQQSN